MILDAGFVWWDYSPSRFDLREMSMLESMWGNKEFHDILLAGGTATSRSEVTLESSC